MNIGYFRVSMEGETIQDLDHQVKVVLDHYKPPNVIVLKERGSAYNLNKLHKRTEFMELLTLLFDIENTTLKDLFTQNIQREEINLYIYDYSRLMRNIELSILFGLLCSHFNITVHCWKDKSVFKLQERIPGERIIKYIMLAMNAFAGEEYSYTTSRNIRKSRKKVKGMSVSSYGKKWGGQLKYSDHTKEEPHLADVETVRAVEKYILSLFKDHGYPMIINKVLKKYNIKVSKAYLTKLSRR
jgi:DNA invertase Pin-like site-specific DNA recombinase